jgi:hypothetical protein
MLMLFALQLLMPAGHKVGHLPFSPTFFSKCIANPLTPCLHSCVPVVLQLLMPAGHKIGQPAPLITEIKDEVILDLRQRFGGNQAEDAANAAAAASAGSKKSSGSSSTAAAGKAAAGSKGGSKGGGGGKKVGSCAGVGQMLACIIECAAHTCRPNPAGKDNGQLSACILTQEAKAGPNIF